MIVMLVAVAQAAGSLPKPADSTLSTAEASHKAVEASLRSWSRQASRRSKPQIEEAKRVVLRQRNCQIEADQEEAL